MAGLRGLATVKPVSQGILQTSQLGNPLTEAALHGITRALASVGRAFICLDPSFTILHASHLLDRFLGEGASKALCGRPVEELLGTELFGARGPLRQALLENGVDIDAIRYAIGFQFYYIFFVETRIF